MWGSGEKVPLETKVSDSLTEEERFYFPNYANRKKALYLVEIIAVILDEDRLPEASELAEPISQGIKESCPPPGVPFGNYPVEQPP